jgi:hypothetical protein
MPGKPDQFIGGRVDMPNNVCFKEVMGHAKELSIRVKALLLEVIAVAAPHVADGADGLDKNLKSSGRSGHSFPGNGIASCSGNIG